MQLAQLVLACALATSSAAESTSSSADSWYKKGNPSKDCDWVAKYSEKRCSVKGYVGDSTEKSAYDVTEGSVGLMDPALDPIPDYNAAGMCTVNVHWHIGAEHRRGPVHGGVRLRPPGPRDLRAPPPERGRPRGLTDAQKEARKLASAASAWATCKNAYDLNNDDPDGIVANEYDWQYCHDMHVGLTYEFHWPHSSIGACQTEWQYQYHFLDGVLCGATIGGLDIATAADALMSRAVGIGVEGQVFTIVNSDDPSSSPYLRPTWDALNSWDTELATDYAYYQGSTTGDAADNEICRGTGGLVTWHTDRECHLVEAKTIDNLCRLMVVVSADDMTPDTYPHGARETTTAELSDTPYTP
ncbi:hypothetical protein JL722_839 [Aureococcus anophagefferens]|nr:hypothetical protein JL722_839 [Aureococcus anophagefferens]